MKANKRFHYAWVVLLAISLIRGFAGPALNGSSGLFLSPVSQELGVGIGQLSLYLSISSVTTLFWLPVAGNLLGRYKAKPLAAAGILLQCISFGALGLMHSVWGWYLLAVPLAMGSALLVNLMGPVLVNRWFATHTGLVMGLMLAVTSLSGAVFQPLLTRLIDSRGWRFTYLAFGAGALVVMLVLALLFLRNKPEDAGQKPFGALETQTAPQTQTPSIQEGVPTKKAMKSAAFYLLILFMVVLTGFATFSQHITTYGLEQGFALTRIGSVLSLSMVGAAIGSIGIGFFSDKAGIVPTSITVLGIGLVSVVLFLVGGGYGVFATAAFLHGLATSAIGVVAPLLTISFFGKRDYEKLLSYITMGAPFASIVLMPAYGFIYDKTGSYRLVFLFLLAALVVGGIGLLAGKKSSARLKAPVS